MKINVGTLVGVGLISLVAFVKCADNTPSNPDIPAASEPSASMQRQVQELRDEFSGHDNGSNKAAKLADFYREWATVVDRDNTSIIRTTGLFRDAHLNALRILDASEKPPVGCFLNEIIEDTLGLDNIRIEQDKSDELVEVLEAICWACEQES